MKKLIFLIPILSLVVATNASAAFDANGYEFSVFGITSTSASVRLVGQAGTSKPVSVEYYRDTCATELKQGSPALCTYGDANALPAANLKAPLVPASGGNLYGAFLAGLSPNSVYRARYSVDNNYCPPGVNCIAMYIAPTVGPWVKFETLSDGSTGGVLTFGSEKLMRGSVGGSVSNLQTVLNRYNGAGLIVDGRFGLGTKVAVQAFQVSKNIPPDGVVGTKTKQALIRVQQGTTVLPTALIQLTNADNGRTVKVSQGQAVTITLNNLGSGGYQFATPADSASLFGLENYQRISATSGALGDFGKDAWTFRANRTGTTTLRITASRPGAGTQPITVFTITLIVG